jgi:hypothetical protein
VQVIMMVKKISIKILVSISFILFLNACNPKQDRMDSLEHQIDSLSKRIDSAYAPGLGEFMVSIQLHHAKLWFAGKNGNWELANFELGEIQEDLDDIQHYNKDRPEIKELPMIFSPLDSIRTAVDHKDAPGFNRSFTFLTITCNNCHQVTKHGFNKIKIPDSQPVTNQVF